MQVRDDKGKFKKKSTPWNSGIGVWIYCGICRKEVWVQKYLIGRKKVCSRECLAKWRKIHPNKGRFVKGHIDLVPASSRGFTDEVKKKMSLAHIGLQRGEKSPRWIKDRTKLKTSREHQFGSRYKEWMRLVKNRDGWKCRINDNHCSGRLEAHHILSWHEFPDLRFTINNGITLCHFHHPRKKSDEKKLAPILQKLALAVTK
jgi:hypothetical protein